MNNFLIVILGLLAGVLGGIFGIGGGIVMIPALVFFCGLTQHQAQGTTLAALVPPIGLLAALRYYYSGNVKLGIAGLLCLGFFVGGWFGAGLVQNLPDQTLKRLFGAFLLFVSIKMMTGK